MTMTVLFFASTYAPVRGIVSMALYHRSSVVSGIKTCNVVVPNRIPFMVSPKVDFHSIESQIGVSTF